MNHLERQKELEDRRRALIDASQEWMQETRCAFDAAMELGDYDLMASAFDSALQIAWGAITIYDDRLPAGDPTRPSDLMALRRWVG